MEASADPTAPRLRPSRSHAPIIGVGIADADARQHVGAPASRAPMRASCRQQHEREHEREHEHEQPRARA